MIDFEQIIATDISACFLALANALDAKDVLTKGELAAAAQERLLSLQEILPAEAVEKLEMLRALATELEQKAGD